MQRIESLDLLRGFAILGILIMNINSFSNIGTGYLIPTIGAGLDGHNAWIHGFSYLFMDNLTDSVSDNSTKIWTRAFRKIMEKTDISVINSSPEFLHTMESFP